MKRVISIVVALLISANLQAQEPLSHQKNLGSKTALLVFFDVSGLNNYNSNNALAKQNLAKYNQIVTKKNLQKARVSSIAYYTFDEQIKPIGKIESTKAGRLYRESKKMMHDVVLELKEDKSNRGKDVISTFYFINSVVQQSYKNEDVTVLLFSNLRDSMSTKQQRQMMQPIVLDEHIHLYIYAASGLNAIAGVTTLQQMRAESSIVKFYSHLLSTSKVAIKTIY